MTAVAIIASLFACKGNQDETTDTAVTLTDNTGAFGSAGVVVAFTSQSTSNSCTDTYQENVLLADIEQDAGGDWDNEYIGSNNYEGTALLFDLADGSVGMYMYGTLYTGTRDGDTLALTMDSDDTYEYPSTLPDAGYEYLYMVTYSYSGGLTLTRDPATGTWSGSLTDGYFTTQMWEESDLWDVTAYANAAGSPSFSGGTFTNAVLARLALNGFANNAGDTVDCDDDICMLTQVSGCTTSYQFTAVETLIDPNSFLIY